MLAGGDVPLYEGCHETLIVAHVVERCSESQARDICTVLVSPYTQKRVMGGRDVRYRQKYRYC